MHFWNVFVAVSTVQWDEKATWGREHRRKKKRKSMVALMEGELE